MRNYAYTTIYEQHEMYTILRALSSQEILFEILIVDKLTETKSYYSTRIIDIFEDDVHGLVMSILPVEPYIGNIKLRHANVINLQAYQSESVIEFETKVLGTAEANSSPRFLLKFPEFIRQKPHSRMYRVVVPSTSAGEITLQTQSQSILAKLADISVSGFAAIALSRKARLRRGMEVEALFSLPSLEQFVMTAVLQNDMIHKSLTRRSTQRFGFEFKYKSAQERMFIESYVAKLQRVELRKLSGLDNETI